MSPYLYPPRTKWPTYTPKHRVLFPLPPTTRKATVEVFEPASARGLSAGLVSSLYSIGAAPSENTASQQFLYCYGVSAVQLSTAEWKDLVGEQSEYCCCCPCYLLLLKACSWSMGIVQKPRARGTSLVEAATRQRRLTTHKTENTYCAVVNCGVCELVIALWLLVVMICKWSTSLITNPNSVYSHSYTWQYVELVTICNPNERV
jgi:hypothetical protein